MSSEPHQIRLRLAGGRFADGHLPLDFLRDLAALGEVLSEIARTSYKSHYTHRKSVPKGFAENISPVITKLERGNSLRIVLQPSLTPISGHSPSMFPHPWLSYLDEAWNLTVEELSVASNGLHPVPVNEAITPVCQRKLRRFGANFKENETSTLYSTDGHSVEYDRVARRQYLAVRFPNQRYNERTSITGRVHEFNAKQNSFLITDSSGHIIQCKAPVDYREDILEALSFYDQRATEVIIWGEVEYYQDDPVAVRDITDVTLLYPRDIDGQVESLRAVPAGWADGYGEAVNRDGLAWLHHVMLTKISFGDDIMPYMYPTEDGNVSVEWTIGSVVADLEINLDTHQALWGQSNRVSHENFERDLNLDEESDWEWLKNTLLKMTSTNP